MGGKKRPQGPALPDRARGRPGVLARHPLERRPDALPGQHALEDEAGHPLGSRIAEVHNGSSLFTGDAGQGESNIRRWIIENDWLEAIVALPLNMFYNTGIATYIWVLTNRKPDAPQGQGAAHRRHAAGSSRCARTSARRTASCPTRTSRASATPSSPSRRPSSRRSSPTRPSATGRSPSSGRCAWWASTPSAPTPPRRSRRSRRAAERTDDAPPVIRKIHKKGSRARSAARPVRDHDRRQARRRRVRARLRSARHRAGAAA